MYRKKIYHFVNTNVVSGLETVVANIATMVDDYEHFYVSPEGPIVEYLRERGVCHVAVPSLTPRTVRDVLLRYSPDIAHGHDVTASVCLAANVVLCRRRGIKLVSHLHNNDERMRHINARSLLYGAASLAFPSVIVVSDPVVN